MHTGAEMELGQFFPRSAVEVAAQLRFAGSREGKEEQGVKRVSHSPRVLRTAGVTRYPLPVKSVAPPDTSSLLVVEFPSLREGWPSVSEVGMVSVVLSTLK